MKIKKIHINTILIWVYYYFNKAERYLHHRLYASLNGEVTDTSYEHYKLVLGAPSLNMMMASNGRKFEKRENSLTVNMTATRLKRLTLINLIILPDARKEII